ncbi:hybrid sensor histidine kinase/response regulator [Noviherbaspirillum pedocola]|uniref:histidine kinase n=1 Tax=Noviherbaspirillum pedocola TaxID=2801341 RepID=A0A934T1J8_9BURK|nr:PAS domain-containing protein [Noviherbaspirillum pedocola]MBK4739116.1 PAS domain-containing protein [Noviherbaspirillum pedocola]
MTDLSDQPHLRGGGAMGALIRCHDWSTTPLGTLDAWPQSLKTAVSLMLRAQQPMFIGWGPQCISLYNDRYLSILGDKHPHALGQPMAEVWSEIWDELSQLNEAVMCGESLSFENRPFKLAGRETSGPHYFSFTYTPLLGDDGQVAGIFCAAIETTGALKLVHESRAGRAAQQALAESEERLRLATDAAEIAFWDVNVPDGSLVWPPRLRTIFGITTDEALSLDDFFGGLHPDDRASVVSAFAAACDPERREFYNIEYRTVGRDDGKVRWVAAKGRGLFDATGRCVRANGTAMEITSRKTAELAMEMALEASRTGTFHWDIQDNLLTWDTALDRLFGLRPGEVVRSLDQFIALVHPDDRHEVIRRCERCRDAGDDFEMEFRVVYPDGSVHWLYDRGRTFLDPTGRAKTMTGACVDITDFVRAREALKLADRQKDDFLATLAHELRNPLAPLRTGLHLVQNINGGMAGQGRRVLGIMQRQLDHMVHLVDDLLDIARIRQGKILLRQESLSLQAVLEQALEGVRALFDAQGHVVVWDGVDPALRVTGDLTRLVQVVGNLLNNAAKYTPRGGRVTLRGGEASLPGMLLIEVTDTGIGIPPNMLDHVFDRFAQVQQHLDHAQGGLGIGLSVVKGLVEMHGGRVAAESAGPGAGSQFRIWLPRADTPAPAEVALPSSPNVVMRRRVLVVDDNRDAAETMALLLDMNGHEALLAHDGQTAVEIVKHHDPAVVFLDIGMPGMNGYETVSVLRELPGAQARVLVALTGWGTEADQVRSLAAGFDLHLTKPVDIHEVQRVLSARLGLEVNASSL